MDHSIRLVVSAVLIFAATGCGAISGRPASPSIDMRLGTSPPSAFGLTNDERATDAHFIVESANEPGDTPTAERVIGVVVLVTGVIVLAAVFCGLYKIATIM
jgi:hypothetical protein